MKNRDGAWGTWIVVLKEQLTGCEKESLGKFLVVWADIPSMSGLACLRLSESMRSPLVGREAITCVLGDAD